MSTLIKNGTVITHAGAQDADVLVKDGKVESMLTPGGDTSADEVIDAQGKYLIPGGIDVHTHMELPFGGTAASDTFETGTRAAAWGGTTTIVDFAVQTKGQNLMDGYEAWMAKAEGNCAIDYGFHMIVGDVTDQSLKEMDIAMGEGVTSFKMFMAYPGVFYSTDGEIFRAMQKASENGATIMMHAENGIAIDVLIAQALGAGRDRPDLSRDRSPFDPRGRSDPSSDQAGGSGRLPALHRPPFGPGGAGRSHQCSGRRPERFRRDLSPVPVPQSR